LVAIYHPDDYDLSTEDEALSRDIDALNDEMKAAAHLEDSKLISDGLQGDGNAFESECLISQERAEAADLLPDPGPNPEQILFQKQSANALMRRLSQLSSGQRAVLLLCEIYEYTAEEVGAMLQVAPGAIRSRLFRARKQLASRLSSPSSTLRDLKSNGPRLARRPPL